MLFFQTSLEQWRKVFSVACSVGVGTYFFFQVFGTSNIQPWNYPAETFPEEDTKPFNNKKATRRDSTDLAMEG